MVSMTSEGAAGMQGWGVWFDGVSTRRRVAHLLLIDDVLRISPELVVPDAEDDSRRHAATSLPMRHRLSTVRMAEPVLNAPLALELPDGSSLWVDEPSGPLSQEVLRRVAQAQDGASKFKLPRARRLIASWPAVLACVVASVALVVWFDRQGAALVARGALQVLPERLDQALGDAVFSSIQSQWLEPSTMSNERQTLLASRFAAVVQDIAPNRKVALHFFRMRDSDGRDGSHSCPVRPAEESDPASSTVASESPSTPGAPDSSESPNASTEREPDGGFNAFALPNGSIVVLDGMSDALNDDELMAVLGHELGHVVHRHSMQSVARSFGVLAVATVVLGDFSSVVSTAVATLQTFRHSRDAEREADDYGRTFAQAARLPPGTEASVWKKLLTKQGTSDGDALPEWMSTHPPTQERLNAAREGK